MLGVSKVCSEMKKITFVCHLVYMFTFVFLKVNSQKISIRLMNSICAQQADFILTATLQRPLKTPPVSDKKTSVCGWFSKKTKSFSTCTEKKGTKHSPAQEEEGIYCIFFH